MSNENRRYGDQHLMEDEYLRGPIQKLLDELCMLDRNSGRDSVIIIHVEGFHKIRAREGVQ